mmetsp:Transcript_18776/g.58410  ORF Transcript_18776/g.58410 Transcript_18776/m.58410 type:complete len:242 (+) Transcript_18776:132-857(+)
MSLCRLWVILKQHGAWEACMVRGRLVRRPSVRSLQRAQPEVPAPRKLTGALLGGCARAGVGQLLRLAGDQHAVHGVHVDATADAAHVHAHAAEAVGEMLGARYRLRERIRVDAPVRQHCHHALDVAAWRRLLVEHFLRLQQRRKERRATAHPLHVSIDMFHCLVDALRLVQAELHPALVGELHQPHLDLASGHLRRGVVQALRRARHKRLGDGEVVRGDAPRAVHQEDDVQCGALALCCGR